MFKYYEDGHEKKVTFRKAFRMFTTLVDNDQKEQGKHTFYKSFYYLLPSRISTFARLIYKPFAIYLT